MNIKIVELKAITEQLFTYLAKTGREEFELEEDYYWAISKEEVYQVTATPTDLTIGQLSDDWNELNNILKGDSPPIGYALVWLSSILRIIGEKSAE